MKAKIFIDKKQDDWFNTHGVYADTNSKIAEWMEEYAQLKAKEELQRLYDWLLEENREPAKTKFTAGLLRNVANEIEFKMYEAKKLTK